MTDEQTTTTAAPSIPLSETAQRLVDDGVKPFIPNVADMLAQMQLLQARIAAMEAEKGIPSDPIAAAVGNLQDHVQAKVNASPSADFSELHKVVKGLAEHPDTNTVTVVRDLISKAIKTYRHLDLSYVEELATDLSMAVLKSASL